MTLMSEDHNIYILIYLLYGGTQYVLNCLRKVIGETLFSCVFVPDMDRSAMTMWQKEVWLSCEVRDNDLIPSQFMDL